MPNFRAVPPGLTRTPAAAWAARQSFAVRRAAPATSNRLIQRGAAAPALRFDPYADYGRFVTPQGGVLIIYKDYDERLRHTLWRILAWTSFTGAEGSFLHHNILVHSVWLNLICFIVAGIVNWLIVRKPVETYRTIEIRPDCMIIEGSDVFWRSCMEQWPTFQQDENGNQILSGIYGTRFVEFLTARRFDENDRMAEVFAVHLRDAMMQQWGRRF